MFKFGGNKKQLLWLPLHLPRYARELFAAEMGEDALDPDAASQDIPQEFMNEHLDSGDGGDDLCGVDDAGYVSPLKDDDNGLNLSPKDDGQDDLECQDTQLDDEDCSSPISVSDTDHIHNPELYPDNQLGVMPWPSVCSPEATWL